MASSILLAQIGPVAWAFALGVPVAGLGWSVLSRVTSREVRARRALARAKRSIASARVDEAWSHLEAALILDATPSAAAADIGRDVLHQVQRLVAPEIEAEVALLLRPLEHALDEVIAGAPAPCVLPRAAAIRTLIEARGEPVPAVLSLLALPSTRALPPVHPPSAVLAS